MARTQQRRNTTRAVTRHEQPAEQEGVTREEEDRRRMVAIANLVADRKSQLESLLSGSIDVERFITVALQAIQSKPALLACDRLSLLGAIRDAATYGLEPAGELGDAAIVPRKGIAHLEIEYRGYRKLALRDGRVAAIDAEVVYEKDDFEFTKGPDSRIVHRPTLDVERGNIRGAYSWARFANGELLTMWMPWSDIAKRRNESQAWRDAEYGRGDQGGGHDSIWHKWPEEQSKKTVLRRFIQEKMTMSPLVQEALLADIVQDARTPSPVASTLAIQAPAGSDARRELLRRMGIADGPATALPAGEPAAADSDASQPVSGRPATEAGEPDADSGATDSGRPGPNLAPSATDAAGGTLELCAAPSPYTVAGGEPSTCRKLKGHEKTDDAGAQMHKGGAGETWAVE